MWLSRTRLYGKKCLSQRSLQLRGCQQRKQAPLPIKSRRLPSKKTIGHKGAAPKVTAVEASEGAMTESSAEQVAA